MIILLFFAIAVAGIFCGYQFGKGAGYDNGYELGYHEGQFDEQINRTPCCPDATRPT